MRNRSSNIQKLLKKSVDGIQSFEYDDDYDVLEELMIVKKIDRMFKPQKKQQKMTIYVNRSHKMSARRRMPPIDQAEPDQQNDQQDQLPVIQDDSHSTDSIQMVPNNEKNEQRKSSQALPQV